MQIEEGKDKKEKRTDSHWMQPIQDKMTQMQHNLGECVPWYACEGRYRGCREDFWVSGFWPGMLWIMYDMTGKDLFREAAWQWDERLERCFVRESNMHHDVGFQFLPSAVIKYKLTGDKDARRRGLFAANFLAGRFNPAGSFIRAWNQEKTGWAIIDSAMNLSLLFWAAAEAEDPRFYHIAMSHARTILKHFIRPDGSVCHVAAFDPVSGEKQNALGGQGYGPDSSWSRGQAWAIYGMANVYRYSGEKCFLDAGKRVAHYFLANLEESNLPCWDFRVPDRQGEPLDSSAAAIAACGLLEIAESDEKDEELYRKSALKLMDALKRECAAPEDAEYKGLLLHGTGNRPAKEQVDVSLIYGDYFYLEALARLSGWKHRIF